MKFRALVLELHLPQNFCHIHTGRHFPEIVKSSSGHPETCKFIKNRKSKICTKTILSSIYIEESKNEWIKVMIFYWRKQVLLKIYIEISFVILFNYKKNFCFPQF